MLSLRAFARARPMPRGGLRLAPRASSRTFAMVSKPASQLLRPAATRIHTMSARAMFATSVRKMAAETQEGSTDSELSATLQSELQLEKESSPSEQVPVELQEYLDASGFEIKDVAGDEEVTLTKQFGNETIKVTFSVADLSTEHDPDAFLQDRALQDEPFDELDGPKAPGDTAAAASSGAADGEASAATPAGDSAVVPDEDAASFPVNLNVFVYKLGQPGAMHFALAAHDGGIGIERFHFFRDAEHADAPTAELQWGARNAYTGPPFGNLDEGLQEVLERYLEERGINTQLALWVPDYIEFKEQREYMQWLGDTRAFVDT